MARRASQGDSSDSGSYNERSHLTKSEYRKMFRRLDRSMSTTLRRFEESVTDFLESDVAAVHAGRPNGSVLVFLEHEFIAEFERLKTLVAMFDVCKRTPKRRYLASLSLKWIDFSVKYA